jgi:uncharacterized protein YqjF (DUF2071 family)
MPPALTAHWTNLVLLTFEAPEAVLRPHIHPALELDRWQGRTHVSLVLLDFEETRVRGIRIPGFVDFPEVNLRTYVRYRDRRGVVFIRELVPSRIVAAAARLWYNEPYKAVPLQSSVQHRGGELTVDRRWLARGAAQRVSIRGPAAASLPDQGSATDHFKEHAWGFGRTRGGTLLAYRVEHPRWAVRQVEALATTLDFATGYGHEWAFLDSSGPVSTIWAVGSEVAVYPTTRVETD